MNLLFFSAMLVSPVNGGQIVYKLLEPPPKEHHVYYATEQLGATITPLFSDISVCYFSIKPIILRGQRFRLISSVNRELRRLSVRKQVWKIISEHQIDLVLASPQTEYDLLVADSLARNGVPTAVWFMDDYYSNTAYEQVAMSLWSIAKIQFVISGAMQERLQNIWGGESQILRSSADFDPHHPVLNQPYDNLPLRVIYTGSLQPYYQNSITTVIDAISKLDGQVTLDIFTPNFLPSYEKNPWCKIHNVVPQSELPGLLAQYDVTLMLSSFEPKWRRIAETSLGSKLADYLACGRPILFFGPSYAENIKYACQNGLGLIVDFEVPGNLTEGLLDLAKDFNLRKTLAHKAWEFGRSHHNRAINRIQLWALLENAADSI